MAAVAVPDVIQKAEQITFKTAAKLCEAAASGATGEFAHGCKVCADLIREMARQREGK